ncbi:O-antigen ligase family protein [Methylocystis sp.]|uniref:O-antigen ligase family protein n=1 Tax=Methylocystis sp. TaxID=1911079 RepID=UPI003DA21F5F
MDGPLSRDMRRALALCGAIAVVPLAQLVPLPPTIWTKLPGRETITAAFELIGRDLPWAPLSMSPDATLLSALSLLPPLAVFLGALLLNHRERQWLSLAVLAVGLASVFVGLMQVARGISSPLWFSEILTPNEAVGFFLNRNHFAALLYSLLPLAAAWVASDTGAMMARAYDPVKKFDTRATVTHVVGFAVIVALIAGQLMARSRAGVILTIVALFGAFALAQRGQGAAKEAAPVGRLIFGATTLAIVFSLQFALYRVLERFETDPLADARVAISSNTIEAAKTLMPFGAGQGAFVPTYAMFQKPQEMIANAYVNHAHNDFLQLWLESGVAGPILIGVFAIWFVLASAKVWRRSYSEGLAIDQSLARAASLIVALLAAHSLFDYPLRSGAMMAVFAVAGAFLIDPPPASPARHPARRREPSRIRSEAPSFGARPQTP